MRPYPPEVGLLYEPHVELSAPCVAVWTRGIIVLAPGSLWFQMHENVLDAGVSLYPPLVGLLRRF